MVGKTGIFESNYEVTFALYLVRLKVNKERIYPKYLNYWLNGYIAQKTIKRIATRAISQANVNPTEFKKHCVIPLPPLHEQTAIASLLSTWDFAIEKTERLIEAKEKQYVWMLSRLVSRTEYPHEHIRSFTEEVSKRNCNDSFDIVLSVTNQNGFVLPEEHLARRVASSDLSNYKIVTVGQYAYNPSREAKERICRSTQGSVRETVSFTDLGTILFPLPPLIYPKQIAETLNTARQEINLLKKQAEAYRKQKRGLMQKRLTGTWRINLKR